MPYLIDGSNLLGVMRADRHSDTAKRRLVTLLAGFARARKTRVTCVFDGLEPPSFARSLGAVVIAFGGSRPADDLIVDRASQGRGWTVVTADRGLAARVMRRHVEVLAPESFLRQLEESAATATDAQGGGEDWDSYFSDPKNRLKF